MVFPCLLSLLLPPITWFVDAANAPGTDFTDLPAAVAAASSGDTIFVHPGVYTAFFVSDKALTIRGADPATTIVRHVIPGQGPHRGTTIDSVPSGAVFHLGGLTLTTDQTPSFPPPLSLPALRVMGIQSRITLQNCRLLGQDHFGSGGIGLQVFAGLVLAERCTISGGAGLPNGTASSGGPACWMEGGNTVFAALDCNLRGGHSSNGSAFASGGSGIFAYSGSRATLSHCSVQGGFANGGTPLSPAQGGHAVLANNGFVRISGSEVDLYQGGHGADLQRAGLAVQTLFNGNVILHPGVSLQPAVAGAALTSGNLALNNSELPHLRLAGTPTQNGELLAGDNVTLSLTASLPSAPFLLAIAQAPSPQNALFLGLEGELVVPLLSTNSVSLGLDPSGAFEMSFTPTAASPTLLNHPIVAQALVLDPSTNLVLLSNPIIAFFAN